MQAMRILVRRRVGGDSLVLREKKTERLREVESSFFFQVWRHVSVCISDKFGPKMYWSQNQKYYWSQFLESNLMEGNIVRIKYYSLVIPKTINFIF